jgi:dCMP deaminase
MADWDGRFLTLAEVVASWSKDPSTKCGAVIVRPDKTIASVGFNGFPRGTLDDPEFYDDRELKYARVVHAEVNAVVHAREPLHGYTLYVWPPGAGPTCDRCAGVVIQSGITNVVYLDGGGGEFGERWSLACSRALDLYFEAGVELRRVVR